MLYYAILFKEQVKAIEPILEKLAKDKLDAINGAINDHITFKIKGIPLTAAETAHRIHSIILQIDAQILEAISKELQQKIGFCVVTCTPELNSETLEDLKKAYPDRAILYIDEPTGAILLHKPNP